MKQLKIYMAVIACGILASACDDGFLDRNPLDQVPSEIFFEKPNDLKVYVNQYYSSSFPRYSNHGSDFDSDNEIGASLNSRLQGTRTVSTTGSIGFGSVRSINYFMDNYKRVEANYEFDEYKQYVGEAYFFKALIYYNLLQAYGDIQWLDNVLGTSSPELYNTRDSRDYVADRIIACLDTAAMYLTEEKGDGTGRVNKWMALLMQSRIALFEGTWEKYHNGTPFGVENADPQKYLEKAAEAAQAVMESGLYSVYSTGDPNNDYQTLFNRTTYASHPEVMFWREYNNELTRGDRSFTNDRNFRMETPTNKTVTKQMVDYYLAEDGKPIAGNPLFQGYNTLADEVQNRDPRLKQSIATPDQVWKIHEDGTVEYWDEVYSELNTNADYLAPTGYVIQKGYNPNMAFHVQQYEETPSILYRYGEVLLNFAEAKAELGTLTQGDLDKSINLLRDRVGMPHLEIGSITTDPNWNFPTLSPLINEIRRERRVELMAEGFRWDDIARWAGADELIIGQRPKGFKAAQLNENPFTVDSDGFLDPFQKAIPEGYGFKEDRDYLNSIPESEIVLNPDLTQNPGW